MEFFRFLKEESGGLDNRVYWLALISGLLHGLMVSLVLKAARQPFGGEGQALTAFMFTATLGAWIMARKWVLNRTSRIVESIIYRVRRRVAQLIRKAELEQFETVNETVVYTVLSEDVQTLSDSSNSITGAISSAILIVFALGYIATISLPAFYSLAGCLLLGMAMYVRLRKTVTAETRKAWKTEQKFLSLLNDAIKGFNELRLNDAKRDDLYDNYLDVLARDAQDKNTYINDRINRSRIFAQAFTYVTLGSIVFVLPIIGGHDSRTTVQIVSVFLFIIGPITEIVGAVQNLSKANAVIDRLREFEATLRGLVADATGAKGSAPEVSTREFTSLGCTDLTFSYHNAEGQPTFTVGPIDLEIKRGSITFLVGGNGSGKSTLLKLLTGLYFPTSGCLKLDDQTVTVRQMPVYRANFSTILQDYHLFDRLYGQTEIDMERADELLDELQISTVTGILPDGTIANLKLSSGQRKRLALLVSELEDHKVLVFDEWAADQDPERRRYFYGDYLQNLRSRGKTVIAATHDEQYFHLADEVLKISNGKITSHTGALFDI